MTPLFAFLPLWASIVVGVAALSIPILIHLFNRKRYRVVVWAAMRFLLLAQKQNTRRMRVEQLLLLAVRCLLLLLLVAAMASVTSWAEELIWAKVWPEGGPAGRQRVGRIHKIIVIDASLSMTAKLEPGKTCFERAREQALKIVGDAASGDGFSVLVMKEAPTWVVAEASLDARRVREEIGSLRVTHGNTSVIGTLTMLANRLREPDPRFNAYEVYFISDLQQATWAVTLPQDAENGDAGGDIHPLLRELKKSASTIFVDVGRDDLKNVAVLDLTVSDPIITTGMPVVFQAAVRNFGKDARPNVNVELLIGRGRSAAGDADLRLTRHGEPRVLDLGAGQQGPPVSFEHTFDAPGTYAVQVRVDADDLEADDARTVIVTVREKIPVLVVNGKLADEDGEEDAAEFLPFALSPPPLPNQKNPLKLPVEVTVLDVPKFKAADLTVYDCIFLCDVGTLDGPDVARLARHLRRGGGLVVTTGDNVAKNLDTYNKLLFNQQKGLLPGRLIGVQEAPARHYFHLHADRSQFAEPPLKAFADDNSRFTLRRARFQQYLRVTPNNDGLIRKILSFMPDVDPEEGNVVQDKALPTDEPALLEWNPPLPGGDAAQEEPITRKQPAEGARGDGRYRGKVILLTTTVNRDWNTWPGSASFLPMVQQLWRLGVAAKVREQSVVVGRLLEEVVSGSEAKLQAKVFVPWRDEKDAPETPTQAADGVTLFRWADTDQAGVYRVTVGKEPTDYLFAVNPPSATPDKNDSESDPTRVDKKRLEGIFPGWSFQTVTSLADVRPPDVVFSSEFSELVVKNGPPIAFRLLLAVLALMLLEVCLACGFGHFTVVPGVKQIPRLRLLWPAVTAALALVLLVTVSGTLLQAAASGDFLSFLPEDLRGLVESFLRINPPSPGESRLWELQSSPDSAMPSWMWLGLGLLGVAVMGGVYFIESRVVGWPVGTLLGLTNLSLYLIVLVLFLPQWELQFVRESWPDVVLILDDSLSMGEPDYYNEAVQPKVDEYGADIRKQLEEQLPGRISATRSRLEALKQKGPAKAGADGHQTTVRDLERRLEYYEKLLPQLKSPGWRPTRLQLAQHLLTRSSPDWLNTLLTKRKLKVHVFHLDAGGRLARLKDHEGFSGDLIDAGKPEAVERTRRSVQDLVPAGNDSRLGEALQQVLNQYAGTPVAGVIFLTDGVTTKGQTIGQLADYAKGKDVRLYFIGIGDDHEIRDLKLHDLQVEDTVYVNDRVIFEVSLTGRGYKDMTLPIVLKVKDKNGKEIELTRQKVQVDASGKSVKIRLKHQPTEAGEKTYIIQAELPQTAAGEKGPNPADLRLQKNIYVQESKVIKVLYIEGSARYEYRFLKNLLERESADKKRNRTVELKVLLTDADQNFWKQDKSAIANFPVSKKDLFEYDVVILGDVDPNSPKLGEARLRDLADFVRERGGGLVMVAGPLYSPHAYKKSALASILPIDIGAAPAEVEDHPDGFRPVLTPNGKAQPMFRFSQDDGENLAIWGRLKPLFWSARGYTAKPAAEILAVHPKQKVEAKGPAGTDPRHPLVLQHYPGAGRCMFIGFDESWRWRFREDEARYNYFWMQGVRYLSRSRISRTEIRTDQQTPYQAGKPIKVIVRFPENITLPGSKPGAVAEPPTDVTVTVEHRDNSEVPKANIQMLKLARAGKTGLTFEGMVLDSQKGKYRFTLSNPDVAKLQPNGQRPSTEADVEEPPGELINLRLNRAELADAARKTNGKVYTMADADDLLDEMPPTTRVIARTSTTPPQQLWNLFSFFLIVVGLQTSLWILRKREHLL